MKKIRFLQKVTVSLLAIVIILVPLTVLGEDEQVTFRDVPWGTDFKSVKNVFSAFAWEPLDLYPGTGVLNSLKDGDDTFTYNTQFNLVSYDPGISVGGHKISRMLLGFALTKNEEGNFTGEKTDSVFIRGTYYIEASSDTELDTWASEYESKLTALYGKPIQTWQDWPTPFSPRINYTLWKVGKVYIRLKKYYDLNLFEDSNYDIIITYAWEDADALLTEANVAQTNTVMNDTDGL